MKKTNPNYDDTNPRIISLFNSVSRLYKQDNLNSGNIEMIASSIQIINHEFELRKYKKGIIYCEKSLSILYSKMADLSHDVHDSIEYLKIALGYIFQAYDRANSIDYKQPSLPKRLGVIKYKLADSYHKVALHYEANQMMRESLSILHATVNEFPSYTEALLEYSQAQLLKLKWEINKLNFHLDAKKSHLFMGKRSSKSRLSSTEYLDQINHLQSTIMMVNACLNQ